jgi:hypothetical protein
LLASGAAVASTIILPAVASAGASAAGPAESTIGGTDLTGWESVLGDGLYTAPGLAPVSSADIAIRHSGASSTLRANTAQRGVMAHNIAFRRSIDASLFEFRHACSFSFRLPYLPTTGAWPDNAQTLEGGFFIWDGGATRLDYGLAFQWVLNPWMPTFGAIRCWSGTQWLSLGYLTPDTNWHTAQLSFDRRAMQAGLLLDGSPVPIALTSTVKDGWGTETAARLQAEVISLWPGSSTVAPSHRAEFRDWSWTRSPYTA